MSDDRGPQTLPSESASDQVYALVRGAIASIPVLGALAAETFGILLVSPYQRRLHAWMEQVTTDLRALGERQHLDLATLTRNDTFVSTLIQATQAAVRTGRQEKLRLLRNAILSAAEDTSIDGDLQNIFVRYVDELTPAHFLFLSYLHANEDRLRGTQSYQDLFGSYLASQTLSISQDTFALIINDLTTRALVRFSRGISDFQDIDDPSYLITEDSRNSAMLRVTDIGRQLLDFVSEYGS